MGIVYAEVVKVQKYVNPARPPDDYGDRLPTNYKVLLKGEKAFRKVYAICHSNVASFYILKGGISIYVRDSDLDNPDKMVTDPAPTPA